MNTPDLKTIAAELNQRAIAHPIGSLQEIRAELHHKRRAGQDIFRSSTIFPKWAFHFGGRGELQFNIGFENDARELRHGVAFSFEPSRNFQRPVEVLRPKVKSFNEFMRLRLKLYGDMRMWHYKDGARSHGYMPKPIPNSLATKDVFVFLGKRQRSDHIDYEVILNDFDRLLGFTSSPRATTNLKPFQCQFKWSFGSDLSRRHHQLLRRKFRSNGR